MLIVWPKFDRTFEPVSRSAELSKLDVCQHEIVHRQNVARRKFQCCTTVCDAARVLAEDQIRCPSVEQCGGTLIGSWLVLCVFDDRRQQCASRIGHADFDQQLSELK